ncbi:Uncharacterised protein [uncultured archaeon]|nr:Uncharacterised protein [uncultured archaeon]
MKNAGDHLAIENKKFGSELERALKVYELFDSVLVGSTPAKMTLPASVGPYLPKTNDLDVLMERQKVHNFATANGLEVVEASLIDSMSVRYGTMGTPTVRKVESPLKVLRMKAGDGKFEFLDSVDFFTPETGVGIIPAHRAIGTYQTVSILGTEMKMPERGFLTSTFVNPVACTPNRIMRAAYCWADDYRDSPRRLKDETLPVMMSYIQEGEERVSELHKTGGVRLSVDYTHYSERVNKTGAYLETNLKPDVLRAAKRIGLDAGEREELLKDVVRSFKSYGKEKISVA